MFTSRKLNLSTYVSFACLWGFVLCCVVSACCLSEDGLYSLSSLLQMVVVDGDSGSITWSYSAPCHMRETPTTSAVTSDQKSVFLFWAEALSAAPPNSVSEPGRVLLSLCRWQLLRRAGSVWRYCWTSHAPELSWVEQNSGPNRNLCHPELCFLPLPFS